MHAVMRTVTASSTRPWAGERGGGGGGGVRGGGEGGVGRTGGGGARDDHQSCWII